MLPRHTYTQKNWNGHDPPYKGLYPLLHFCGQYTSRAATSSFSSLGLQPKVATNQTPSRTPLINTITSARSLEPVVADLKQSSIETTGTVRSIGQDGCVQSCPSRGVSSRGAALSFLPGRNSCSSACAASTSQTSSYE